MEQKRLYGLRIDYDDLVILNKWGSLNSYPTTWAIRRAIKDFIKNYCDTGIIPPGEIVNKGCIKVNKVIDN